MSSIVTIETKIPLESSFLNKKLYRNILKKLDNAVVNKCTKDHGYFLRIIRLKRVKDNYISSNCENMFIVEYEAEVLKPEIGNIVEGTICMVFAGGIFLNIQNVMKILVPLSKLEGYSHDPANESFKSKKDKLTVGQNVKVKIEGVKYTKENFSCFGILSA